MDLDTLRGRHLRDRQRPCDDHHQPPGALQRVPRQDRRRAHLLLQARLGEQRGRRRLPDRRGRPRVQHRRRSEAARGDRRLRSVRDRHLRGRGSAPRHPRHPQAGDRGGQRLRDRRRSRHPPALRSDDRVGEREVRPGRPARRLVRRRFRHGVHGARDRREAHARDLVPLRQYTAEQALDWGLINKVVPADQLAAEVRQWADEMLALSPTALKVLKQSMNIDTEQFASMGRWRSRRGRCSARAMRPKRATWRSTRSARPTSRPYRGQA